MYTKVYLLITKVNDSISIFTLGHDKCVKQRGKIPRESGKTSSKTVNLDMCQDTHNKAFTFFGDVPLRMVYDNLKTVVDTVFVGKQSVLRRFLL
jgi:hypothetical protein